ncbi:MAG: sugar transferase [Actinobacteria bacterium]|nr:sugar transferase [Actinomycetota bacterium]
MSIHNLRWNLKYWGIVVVLLLADGVASWVCLFFSLVQYLETSGVSFFGILFFFLVLQSYWALLFYFNGRYRVDPTLSRYNEIQNLFKLTLETTVIAVIYNELVGFPIHLPSVYLLQYWLLFVFCLILERLVIREVQKIFLRRGYGRKNTLIVGFNDRAKEVTDHLKNPKLGYNIVGFVVPESESVPEEGYKGIPIVASVDSLENFMEDHYVSEVVVAIEEPNHEELLDVISVVNGKAASLKIIPDLYEVVSGFARTEQILGLPLVQINPEIISFQQRLFKRVIDLFLALFVVVPFLPVWLAIAVAIKLDSKGPIFYKQDRLGLNNKVFTAFKFRSMIFGAESDTGPIWAKEDDPRITQVGKFLRRFRLDEIPQFINVILGQMSVVGPRPERPFFAQKLIEEYPFYHRRNRIRPGITGWAQIKHPYDTSIDAVRKKLKYDFFYIENLSLSLDLKIIINTIFVMFSGKGH